MTLCNMRKLADVAGRHSRGPGCLASFNHLVDAVSGRSVEVGASFLHWRREAILAVGDTRGLQRSVSLLFGRNDEDFDPWLEVALVTGRKGDDWGVRWNGDLLFPVLVFKG